MPGLLSFFAFPRELRDKVYQNVYTCPTNVFGDARALAVDRPYERHAEILLTDHPNQGLAEEWVSSSKAVPGHSATGRGTTIAALLFTCRQIHQEAVSFLYGNQIFSLNSISKTDQWLRAIGTRNAQSIQHVVLGADPCDLGPSEDGLPYAWVRWNVVLYQMPNLRTIKAHPMLYLGLTDPAQARIGQVIFTMGYEASRNSQLEQQNSEFLSPYADYPKNRQHLETLVIQPLTFGTEWAKALSSLPKLKHLAIILWRAKMQPGIYDRMSRTLTLIEPLQTFAWASHYLPIDYATKLQVQHGRTLRALHLDFGWASMVTNRTNFMFPNWLLTDHHALFLLLANLPVLEALRYCNWRSTSTILRALPPTLKILDAFFDDRDGDRSLANLTLLPQRCPQMQKVRLLNRSNLFDLDNSDSQEIVCLPLGWHQGLDVLRSHGISTTSVTCLINRCQVREDSPVCEGYLVELWICYKHEWARFPFVDINETWPFRPGAMAVENCRCKKHRLEVGGSARPGP